MSQDRSFEAWQNSAKVCEMEIAGKQEKVVIPLDAMRISIPMLRKCGYNAEANKVEIFLATVTAVKE